MTCVCPKGRDDEIPQHQFGCHAIRGDVERRPFIDLATPCCLAGVTVREAALKIGPAWSYTLHACHADRFTAYQIARDAQVPDHPFAPYINVVLDADRWRVDAIRHPWWITNDKTKEAYGSIGS